jgi:hypothetical protein
VHEDWLAKRLKRVVNTLNIRHILNGDEKFPLSVEPNNDAVGIELHSLRRVD